MCTSCAKENVAAVCYYIHWHTNRRSPRTHQNIGCKCTFATNKDWGGRGASVQAAIENNIMNDNECREELNIEFQFLPPHNNFGLNIETFEESWELDGNLGRQDTEQDDENMMIMPTSLKPEDFLQKKMIDTNLAKTS